MRSLYLFCPCHWKWLKPKKKDIMDRAYERIRVLHTAIETWNHRIKKKEIELEECIRCHDKTKARDILKYKKKATKKIQQYQQEIHQLENSVHLVEETHQNNDTQSIVHDLLQNTKNMKTNLSRMKDKIKNNILSQKEFDRKKAEVEKMILLNNTYDDEREEEEDIESELDRLFMKKKEIDDFNIIEENEIQNNNNISWNALDVTKRHHHCLEQNNNNNNLEIKVD